MSLPPKPCGECGDEKDPVDGLVRIHGPPRREGSTRRVCTGCIPDVVPWLFSYLDRVEVRCAFCDAPVEYFLRTPSGVNPYCPNCVDRDTVTALDYLVGSLETEVRSAPVPD